MPWTCRASIGALPPVPTAITSGEHDRWHDEPLTAGSSTRFTRNEVHQNAEAVCGCGTNPFSSASSAAAITSEALLPNALGRLANFMGEWARGSAGASLVPSNGAGYGSVLPRACRRTSVRGPSANATRASIWLSRLKLRGGPNVAAVALANKNARVMWALLARGDSYRVRTDRASAA